jgi:hypothetical protein
VAGRCWTLDASDFPQLWEDCQRCFYLKVARGFPRPRATPSLDSRAIPLTIDCHGRRSDSLVADMPAGVLELGELRAESEPIDVHLPDAVRHCRLLGKVDTVLRLDGGGHALVSVELGEPRVEPVSRALHAMASALEHAAKGSSALGPIRRLGILAFAAQTLAREAEGRAALAGPLRWIEVPRDDGAFVGFLAEVISVLDGPEPPGGGPMCQWCVYRDASRRTGL